MDQNRELAPVRRRRKVNRGHREGENAEGSVRKVCRNGDGGEREEDEESTTSSATNTTNDRSDSFRSANMSAHKSKILNRRDKVVAAQRSHSQPKIEAFPKEKKSSDLFAFMKVARRSLSSPRNKDGSRDTSPNPKAISRSGKSSQQNVSTPISTPINTLEVHQLTKLELNLRRFEEERRKFEDEKRKFETERRELDRIRLKRLEERDKKRIAEGYQQLLALRTTDQSRKASLKVSDPEESQRLIESFDKAQEICLSAKVSTLKKKKSQSPGPLKMNLVVNSQPPDIVASSNNNVRRSTSLRRRRVYEPSTSEDADDEYATERKSSLESTKPKEKDNKEKMILPPPSSIESSKGVKLSWFSRMFSKTPKNQKDNKKRGSKTTKFGPPAVDKKPSSWKLFKERHQKEIQEIRKLRRKCVANIIILVIFCGFGGLIFRFVEGAVENFYKCGVKKVKRDFVDQLWSSSHNMREEEWKSMARNKLRKFEEELQNAFDSGMSNYSGQKAWSFLNSWVYCFSVITTIGYGHIAPATTAGRSITILYSVIGIPIFLIVLADFGKLFTRGIKFLWAYARGLYYTGSCRKVRKTVQVQDVMKGMNSAYDFMRRPSTFFGATEEDVEKQEDGSPMGNQLEVPNDENTPQTPMPSEIEIDDEFNLPISLALVLLISYILFGAAMYSMWETWTFFESFYFVFISMSTIGFGDYVPNHPIFMMASIIYLVFGLALTSMCINVVQLKLSDSFRQASSKIRETIGLTEEIGSSQNETPCADVKSEGSIKIDPPPEIKMSKV